MHDNSARPVQFGLKWVFVAVFAASLVAALFRWLDTDYAISALLLLVLFAPIAYHTDWPDTLKTLAWTALVGTVVFAGCRAFASLIFQGH